MSSKEIFNLPYSLLMDPVSGKAAAYSQNHRLVTAEASAKLVAFANANAVQRVPWDESQRDPTGLWRPLPAWATDDVRARCELVWIRKGASTDEYLASIPKR